MGFFVRLWGFQHSIGGVKYTIGHVEHRYPLDGGHCNQFMAVGISRAVMFEIPCHVSSNGGVEDADKTYYEFHELDFVAKVRSLYPDIVAVDHVAKKFTEILKIANASHRCPEYSTNASHRCPGYSTNASHRCPEYSTTDGLITTRHMLDIRIEPQGNHDDEIPASEYIYLEKVDVGRGEMREVVSPRVRPASRASVVEILNSMAVLEGECGICLEDIVSCSSNAIKMPCSHSFHRVCLVQWFNTNHSCPICRFQIPAAQYKWELLLLLG